MSYQTALAAIEQRFQTQWGTTTPVQWPNRNYEPVAGDEWVRLTVLDGQSFMAGMGFSSNLFRHPGLIIVSIFVPRGSGERRVNELVDSVSGIWRNAQFGEILCRAPSVEKVGESGEWYQVNVSVPFQRDTAI